MKHVAPSGFAAVYSPAGVAEYRASTRPLPYALPSAGAIACEDTRRA